MNIYDISKKAGVSIATVSRVMNGSAKVSEKTKEKVLSVMNETGYTPNVFARGLMSQSVKTIGVLCPDSADAYLAKGVYHVERSLRESGYDCILCCTGYEQEQREKYMELLLSKKVDAIIMIGSTFVQPVKKHQDYIYRAATQLPVIIINGRLAGENIYSYYCDDEEATCSGVEKMIKNGSRRILFLQNTRSYSGRKKLAGYQKALRKNQIAQDDSLVVLSRGDMKSTKEHLIEMDRKGIVFDSVVAGEDYLAVAALKYAKSKKLNIPEEFQIIGYNNSDLAECCDPELTSIDSKVEELAKQAVSNLILVLRGEEAQKEACVPGELKERETTR